MEEGFIKGQSDNLPRVDSLMVAQYFLNNKDFTAAEIRGIKLKRTEYWQSQARKYCEFCKCWLADNKVSISFHENGKRHKESVAKHISTLSKRSAKEHKQQCKMDDDLKKMEEAAMKAYMKDVQENSQCDYTSQKINAMLEASGSSTAQAPTPAPAVVKKPPLWHEVKNDGGSYYWHTVNNETTWDPPDEYLSIAEQEAQELKKKENQKLKEQEKKEKQKEALKEAKAHIAREQMRELAAPAQLRAPPTVGLDFGPAPRPDPYGTWTTVVHEPVEKVDLQLPATHKKPPPPVVMEPEVIRFKERKVESLGEGPVEFKRRKIGGNRNMRQKTTDD